VVWYGRPPRRPDRRGDGPLSVLWSPPRAFLFGKVQFRIYPQQGDLSNSDAGLISALILPVCSQARSASGVPFWASSTPLRCASWLTTSIFIRALISPDSDEGDPLWAVVSNTPFSLLFALVPHFSPTNLTSPLTSGKIAIQLHLYFPTPPLGVVQCAKNGGLTALKPRRTMFFVHPKTPRHKGFLRVFAPLGEVQEVSNVG